MPGPGRNEPCPCGSGRKVKRCCGELRGPSEEQLARAHVAMLARDVARDIADLSDAALDDLWDGLSDLPALDLALLVTLPKLIGPDLQHLLDSVGSDDADWRIQALIRVAADIDTFGQRARLADALVRLRDQRRISHRQAAAAIVDLDSPSSRFIDASLLESIALAAGAICTPGGLQLAAQPVAEVNCPSRIPALS